MEFVCHERVISLQYVDDTLLFLKHDLGAAWHLKWMIVCSEKLSCMKIKYNKSDMTPINFGDETQEYVNIFCCKVGSFSFKYLGVSLHLEKLKRGDIQPSVDIVINRIPGW
jgi:hypothetical protein